MEYTAQQFMDVENRVIQYIKNQLAEAWQGNTIDTFLHSLNCDQFLPDSHRLSWEERCRKEKGKVLVVGDSEIKASKIIASLQNKGIPKDRIELRLGYNELKNFKFTNLQYGFRYGLILVGPMPHSTRGKGDFSSTLVRMETEEGYPPIIRLGTNCLKITKTNIKNAIQTAIEKQYILV